MAWIRLDDQIAHHPKFTKVSPSACWLYVAAIGFSQKYLTDGFLTFQSLSTLSHVRFPSKLAQQLIRVGLWRRGKDGYYIHDYLEFNESAQQVKARKREDRLRKSARNPIGIQSDSTAPRGRDPIPSHPKEEKIRAVASPQLPKNGNGHDKSRVRVITRLAHQALDEGATGGDLTEGVKTLCAQHGISYNSELIRKAIESAETQRRQ